MIVENGIFTTETEILKHAQEILGTSLDNETVMKNEYIYLVKNYEKLLRQTKKLITLADNTQKRLKETNEVVEEKVHQLIKAEEELRKLAITDTLTGLYNRRGIKGCIEHNVIRTQRNNTPFTVFLIDIDHFKLVNDKFGHRAGDHVLTIITRALQKSLRAQDDIARWGGEEFLIILPDTDSKGGEFLADKMRKIVEALKIDYNDCILTITVSFGGCCFNKGSEIENCIEHADEALYRSKTSGRNKVSMYEN